MSDWAIAATEAFWYGFMTSISPCLLATNIAAISFLSRRVDSLRFVFLSCACYIVGQAAAYVLLATALVESLLSITSVSFFLQNYMIKLVGPLLIVCALFLLELIDVQFSTGRMKAWAQSRANTGGFYVAALLGVVFGMSFCPTTAAWFFIRLIPLSIEKQSSLMLPLLYAIGVALPVMAFSVIIAISANRLTTVFARVGQVERYARYTAGAIFLLVGIYSTLALTLEVF